MILAQLFEPDDGDAGLFDGGNRGLEAGLFDKGAAGEHCADPCRRQCRDNGCRAGRVVEHGGHPAGRLQRQEGDDRGIRIGQHDAHGLARFAHLCKPGGKHAGADQEFLVGQLAAQRIFEHRPRLAIPVGGVPECQEQAAVEVVAGKPGFCQQVMNPVFVARIGGAVPSRLRIVEIEQCGLRQPQPWQKVARCFRTGPDRPERKARAADMQGLKQGAMLAGETGCLPVGGQGFRSGFGVLRKSEGDRPAFGKCRLDGGMVAGMRGAGKQPHPEQQQRALIVFMQHVQAMAVQRRPKHCHIKTRLAGVEVNNRPVRACGCLFLIGKMKVEEGPELEQGNCLSEPALSLARHGERGEQTARDSQTNQRCHQARHARPPSCPPGHEGFSHDPGGCSRGQA
jgi:hypothetical protein